MTITTTEDAGDVLGRVLAAADALPGIDAVIQTGSRARGTGVDDYSDLDIEFIGPGSAALVGRDDWTTRFGDVLVALHLTNEEPDEPDHPTCLIVLAGGRKVDVTLAGPERIQDLVDNGLDETYQRGYVVHRDRTGATRDLPASDPRAPEVDLPDADEFDEAQRSFWFEATQVPTYLARGDHWHTQLRLAEMRDELLRMLGWHALARSGATIDIGWAGHHVERWVDPRWAPTLPQVFATHDVDDERRALLALVDLYAPAAVETGELLTLPALTLHDQVRAIITRAP